MLCKWGDYIKSILLCASSNNNKKLSLLLTSNQPSNTLKFTIEANGTKVVGNAFRMIIGVAASKHVKYCICPCIMRIPILDYTFKNKIKKEAENRGCGYKSIA